MADTPRTPTVGTLTLSGRSPSPMRTVRRSAFGLMMLRRYRQSHAVAFPAAPADLLHTMTVRVALDNPLLHTLTIVSGALNAPLLHLMTAQNPMIGLNHILRVLPPVVVLGSDDVQKPVQQVTKTP